MKHKLSKTQEVNEAFTPEDTTASTKWSIGHATTVATNLEQPPTKGYPTDAAIIDLGLDDEKSLGPCCNCGVACLTVTIVLTILGCIAVLLYFVFINTIYKKSLAEGPLILQGSLRLNETFQQALLNPDSTIYREKESAFIFAMNLTFMTSNLTENYGGTRVVRFENGSIRVIFEINLRSIPSIAETEEGVLSAVQVAVGEAIHSTPFKGFDVIANSLAITSANYPLTRTSTELPSTTQVASSPTRYMRTSETSYSTTSSESAPNTETSQAISEMSHLGTSSAQTSTIQATEIVADNLSAKTSEMDDSEMTSLRPTTTNPGTILYYIATSTRTSTEATVSADYATQLPSTAQVASSPTRYLRTSETSYSTTSSESAPNTETSQATSEMSHLPTSSAQTSTIQATEFVADTLSAKTSEIYNSDTTSQRPTTTNPATTTVMTATANAPATSASSTSAPVLYTTSITRSPEIQTIGTDKDYATRSLTELLTTIPSENGTSGFIQRQPKIHPALSDYCGTRPADDGVTSRIVGGSEAAPGAWPWMGSLRQGNGHQCGAILIHEEWAITAQHCVGYFDNILLGDTHLYGSASAYRVNRLTQAFSNADFNVYTDENDIALVRLLEPVKFNDYVHPLCINTMMTEFTNFSNCYVTGWGTDDLDIRRPQTSLPSSLPVIPILHTSG